MEQVLGDDHLCYILLNFAGELGGTRDIFVLYDTNTFEVRRTLRSDDWVGRAIAFSPDSSKIAIGTGKIALYETETGDPVRVP